MDTKADTRIVPPERPIIDAGLLSFGIVTAKSTNSAYIDFKKTFPGPPYITCSIYAAGVGTETVDEAVNWAVRIDDWSAEGFTLIAMNNTDKSVGLDVGWIAVLP